MSEKLSEYFEAALYYIDGEARLRASTAPEIRDRIAALEVDVEQLRRLVCSCGFTDFDDKDAHHPQCRYRNALAKEQSE